MTHKIRACMVVAAILLAGGGVAVGAWGYFAVRPGWVAAPGGSEVWQALRPGDGWEAFWTYREGLRYYGAGFFLLTVALGMLHYVLVGPDRVSTGGRAVERYRRREVLTHTALGVLFLVLWASGLYLLLGQFFLSGPAPFWGRAASAAHIWGGLVFLLALVAMWLEWRRDMGLVAHDREWLRRAATLTAAARTCRRGGSTRARKSGSGQRWCSGRWSG
ncbi:MAG: hypothetical protein ACE5JU_03960 [Candidatus Binatia bacterium]